MKNQEKVLNEFSMASRLNDEKPKKISLLVNSIYYFIESVFILALEDGYRLIAIHQGRLLTDETYKTARGAKIAFFKFYGNKAWRDGVKAQWSRFYPPDPDWFDGKLAADKIEK